MTPHPQAPNHATAAELQYLTSLPLVQQAIEASERQQDEAALAQRLPLLDQLAEAEAWLNQAKSRLEGLASSAASIEAQRQAVALEISECEVAAQSARSQVRELEIALRALGEGLVGDACNMLMVRIRCDEAAIERLRGSSVAPTVPGLTRRPHPDAKRHTAELQSRLEAARSALDKVAALRGARQSPREIAGAVVSLLDAAGVRVTVQKPLPARPTKPDWGPATWLAKEQAA
jgi:hypothetical protein